MTNERNATLGRGLSAHDTGDFKSARLAYRELLEADPMDIDANFFFGMLLLQTGDTEPAEASLARAAVLRPEDSGPWNYLGLARLKMDCTDVAATAFEFSSRCDPMSDDAFYNSGIVLRARGFDELAVGSLRKATVLNPSSWLAFSNLGSILKAPSSPDAARAALLTAIRLAPEEVGPVFKLGLLFQDERQWSEALNAYQSAARLLGKNPTGFDHLGDVFRQHGILMTTIGRSFEACNLLERSLVLQPGSVLSWNNYGNALKEMRLSAKAMLAYERALEIDSDHSEAQWNKALLLLLNGNLVSGFSLYESRWQVRELFPTARNFAGPRYAGREPISGLQIFLFAEQGFGDTLQFCRFAKRLCSLGATVTLEAPAPLVPLLQQSGVATNIVAQGGPEPAFDFYSPLMSLPAAWGFGEGDIGMEGPYLHADPMRAARWGEIIQREQGVLNIGICWRGGSTFRGDIMRSIEPHFFASLGQREDVVLYSLQKGGHIDALELAELGIACFDEDFDADGAFLDSIAVLEHLDLIITVDTAIAHLAAAAGKPTWIMLSRVPDWRWMLDRQDSPWYPSVRLFRQPDFGDWAAVFQDLERELDGAIGTLRQRIFN